jgi:hypothetical protein
MTILSHLHTHTHTHKTSLNGWHLRQQPTKTEGSVRVCTVAVERDGQTDALYPPDVQRRPHLRFSTLSATHRKWDDDKEGR